MYLKLPYRFRYLPPPCPASSTTQGLSSVFTPSVAAVSFDVFFIAAGTATARMTAATRYTAMYFFCSIIIRPTLIFTKIYVSKTALMPCAACLQVQPFLFTAPNRWLSRPTRPQAHSPNAMRQRLPDYSSASHSVLH